MDPVYKPTPESSPELTKKSWFGSLMASEKDETFTILITGKPLSTVKADLIHALLSVSTKKLRIKYDHVLKSSNNTFDGRIFFFSMTFFVF